MSYVQKSLKYQKTSIATKEEVRALMKSNFKAETTIYGFYTSIFDRIIKDEEYMVLPLYDRQVNRGHSVFDTLDIINGKGVLFNEHLARLQISCSLAKIPLPMSIEKIKEKITDLASFCLTHYNLHKGHFFIRYWVSSGGHSFGILPPKDKKSHLFVAAFSGEKDTFKQINEVTIDTIIPKEGILANSKTTNYLINSLFAMEGKNKGGTYGIMIDRDGFILEQPIANVVFVFKNGDFVIPKLEKILKGTTLMECLNYIQENLIKTGQIKQIVQMDIRPSDVYKEAKEMIVLGGNAIYPVKKYDNHIISEEPGPIAHLLKDHMEKVIANSVAIPVDRYKKPIPNPKL